MNSRVLIVDDERLIRTSLQRAFADLGSVEAAGSRAEALALLGQGRFDLVVLDLKLGDGDGLEVLRRIRETSPDTKVVMITAHGSVDAAVEAMKLGAFDFVKKPFELEELLTTGANALRAIRLERRVAYHDGRERGRLEEAVVAPRSPSMIRLAREVEILASQPVATMLVVGETGSGKGVVARRLHFGSDRAGGPFVELNAATLPEQLVESELFGHERGAFSDARERKSGLVEVADGGTLFLDEIGELPLLAQAKLLQFLESFSFRRVGATVSRSVDVRLVAATNADLSLLVKENRFRADLYYRLAPITLVVPPLRERREDVRPLAEHFLSVFAQRYKKRFASVDSEAGTMLEAGRWPGNVRELRGVIQRAVLMNDAEALCPQHLPADVVAYAIDPVAAVLDNPASTIPTLDEIERRYMRTILNLTGGNKLRAAERLGITRQTLAKRLGERE